MNRREEASLHGWPGLWPSIHADKTCFTHWVLLTLHWPGTPASPTLDTPGPHSVLGVGRYSFCAPNHKRRNVKMKEGSKIQTYCKKIK